LNPCLAVKRGRHRCNAAMLLCLFSMLLAILLQSCYTEAFILGNPSGHICHNPLLTLASSLSETENAQVTNDNNDNNMDDDVSYYGDILIESYEHKTFKKLTYLYKKASPGREGDRPIILIHPVGIGISSWFWKKVMMQSFTNSEDKCNDDYKNSSDNNNSGNPPIYAPDLIGCGIDHGGDAWYPNENGLFFPLGWVQGVETLMNDIIIPTWYEEQNNGKKSASPSSLSRFFGNRQNNQNDGISNSDGAGAGCLVIAQGGLAPVGIMLAHRNPLHVQNLMLTSPPTYDEITTPIPESELRTNYDFLRSPKLGKLAFAALESRSIIKFFSNLFLFDDDCDEEWLDETERESRHLEARTPVQVFNAGLLQHRSLEEELKELGQSMVVVSGEGDKRVLDRQLYRDELEKCTLTSIGGCNVLPWENAAGVVELIKELGY